MQNNPPKDRQKVLESLKKAKEAVDQTNKALISAIQELAPELLDQVSGGGEFDDVPGVDEHPYNPDDKDRY